MKMKKYNVFKKDNQDEVLGVFDTKDDASEFIINECEDGECNIFDFDCKEVEEQEPKDICPDYDKACEYLGINSEFVFDCEDAHRKAFMSLYMLTIIAQAWNKIDGFVPDYSNSRQDKWFPWFYYNKEHAGFVFASTFHTPAVTYAYFGSRLCFKSSNRARQFGEMFTDLFNDFLLFNK